jgi:hypothetical protein
MLGRRILLINLFLLTGVILCAYQIHHSWQSFEETQRVKRMIVSALDGNDQLQYDSQLVVEPEEVEHDFFEIYERNLFSPLRSPTTDEEAGEEEESAPQFPKRPQMNGASRLGGQLTAFLTLFPNAKAMGESKEVTLGDDVHGYTVAEITDKTVTLKWNEVEEIIDMAENEPIQMAQKGQSKLAAVNIIRIGSALAAVETTTAEEGRAEENRGLQIGVVRGQQGRAGTSRGIQGRNAGSGSQLSRGSRGITGAGGSRNLPRRP